MWITRPTEVSDDLRQGDLIADVPWPSWTRASIADNVWQLPPIKKGGRSPAVVVEQCCAIDNQNVVMLARVVRTMPLNDAQLRTLKFVDPLVGQAYNRYEHLLEPHESLPDPGPDRRHVIDLTDRLPLRFPSSAERAWLLDQRTAQMTVTARAHLRQRLAVTFARPDPADVPLLKAAGLDLHGLAEPPV